MINYTQIIDISWPITEQMTSYKNGNEVKFAYVASYDQGHGYRKSLVTMSSHSGTHIDAPSHFMEDGLPVETIPLTSLVGPCKVLDLRHCTEKITSQDLAQHDIQAGDRILLQTKNSDLLETAPFDQNFIYIDYQAALFLAEKKIKAIGIDYLGIERHQPGHETHSTFFSNAITILEGLRLKDVIPGNYFLCCLPLNIHGLEGAPARAILLK